MSLEDAQNSFFSQLGQEDNTPKEKLPQPQGIIQSTKQNNTPSLPAEKTQSVATSGKREKIKKITPNHASKLSVDTVGKKPKKEYSHHSFSELCKTPAPIKYWVKGYIQEQALHMIFGEPACGKSFVAIDVGASIGCDDISEWHGIKLKHGPVIYLAGEGAAGLRKRCAGWAAQRNVKPENVRLEIFDEVFHLDDDNKERPEYSIDNTIENIRAVYDKPALIIIDTLHVFMKGDENKAVDVATMLASCRKLIRELECAVMIIHHVGVNKDAKGRGRGSSSLKGAMDIEMQITKNDNISNIITIEQTKNKEDKLQPQRKFKLIQNNIPNWFDEDGQPVTTCTIEYDAQATEAAKTKPEKEMPQNEKTARASYRDAIEKYGFIIHDEETGQDLAAVDIEDWRKVFYAQTSADNPDTKRKYFNNARKDLLEKKKILTKKEKGKTEYYCIPITSKLPILDTFTQSIIAAIRQREADEHRDTTNDGGNIGLPF